MATNYIPNSDEAFSTWADSFMTPVISTPTAFGLTAADATNLNSLRADWDDGLVNHNFAQSAARSARVVKDVARQAFEEALRAAVRRIQAHPGLTDAQRTTLGITVPDPFPTPNLAVPESRPVGTVDTSERLLHTISFRDVNTPTKRARPPGIKGCEVWIKVGTPPAEIIGDGEPADMRMVALSSATPKVVSFDTADGGKTAYYILRWVSTRDLKGPWSETLAATIVG